MFSEVTQNFGYVIVDDGMLHNPSIEAMNERVGKGSGNVHLHEQELHAVKNEAYTKNDRHSDREGMRRVLLLK